MITTQWKVGKRKGKVFVDYNQNVRGKTIPAPYSPRAMAEATVSMPLSWEELGRVYPTDFTVLTAAERVSRVGDPWAGLLEAKQDLTARWEPRQDI